MPAAARISDENSLCRPGTRLARRAKPSVADLTRAGASESSGGVGGRRTIAAGATRGAVGNPGACVTPLRLACLGGTSDGAAFRAGGTVGGGAIRAGAAQ